MPKVILEASRGDQDGHSRWMSTLEDLILMTRR